jgi:hypothetical protein
VIVVTQHADSHTLAESLQPLWIARYQLWIRPRVPLVLPYWGRGNILRGALGLAFRRLVCHDLSLACRSCPLNPKCPYPEVFEPAPPLDGDRLRGFSDVPRPFVVETPAQDQTTFLPSERVAFGLTVFGRASRHVAYFVAAVQALADDGLGPRRARFRLEAVEAVGVEGRATDVYRRGHNQITPTAVQLRSRDLLGESDRSRTSLKLRFRTPTDIRDGGRVVTVPLFGPLIRRLRDRASALAAFYGDAPLDVDFKGLSDAANTVGLVWHDTRTVALERPSTRTGQRHDIGGFVGTARYEGAEIGKLMPLIRLGERIHVGKHAAFGNGAYEVVR